MCGCGIGLVKADVINHKETFPHVGYNLASSNFAKLYAPRVLYRMIMERGSGWALSITYCCK